MGLKFLLDEDISYSVADGLRDRGVDALSVSDLGRAGASVPDEEQLEAAQALGRVLVTFNRSDYQAIDARWRHEGRSHPGILWCASKSFPNRAIGDLVRALEQTSKRYDFLDGLCLVLERATE